MRTLARLSWATMAVVLAFAPVAARAAGFAISANGIADNGMLPKSAAFDKTGSNAHLCGGANQSPGYTWTNPPEKTTSYAILEVDPAGTGGMGSNHLVVYNIPAPATTISTEEIGAGKYTLGRATGDIVDYPGDPARSADAPHHYVVTLFALDVLPSLPAALDHDGVLAAIKGHVLAATTTVMRFTP